MMASIPNNPAPRLRTAIVGLGQAGSRFDEEPGRKSIWSHAGAYLALADRVALCGAVEVDALNANAFRARCPTIPVYSNIDAMVLRHRPQIASISTPPSSHADILFKLLECPDLRLIWCEKPLSLDLAEAQRILDACRARGVLLMVSYNRRWLPLWRRVQTLIGDGTLGTVRSIRVAMPNRLFSIGSHAVDLALFLGGAVEAVTAQPIPSLEETGEPAVSALLRYRSGAIGIVQVTGMKHQLIVEVEAIGDDARMTAREDNGEIAVERFVPSHRFSGYRELARAQRETVGEPAGFSAFVAMAENAINAVAAGATLVCDGASAVEVQRILTIMSAVK